MCRVSSTTVQYPRPRGRGPVEAALAHHSVGLWRIGRARAGAAPLKRVMASSGFLHFQGDIIPAPERARPR